MTFTSRPRRQGRLVSLLFVAAVTGGACSGSGDREVGSPGQARVAPAASPAVPQAPLNETVAHKADPAMDLPSAVGAWKRPAVPRTVATRDIFDYMDGAGELYLAYRFDHLDVYDYTSEGQGNILVELYWMKHSDDAFGLLSGDWGGESVTLSPAWKKAPPAAGAPPHRALYGAGLLRIWSDRLYVRVLASQETPASRQAVLDLGRAVVAGQAVRPAPALLGALPPVVAPSYRVRADHVWFLRSYLVLNSAYFLATENVLNLDLSTEAVVAPYGAVPATPGRKPIQLILVRYQSASHAQRALAHFREVYLPESLKGTAASGQAGTALAKIEDGWVGYRVSGRSLAVACECPGREQASRLIEEAVRRLERLEVSQDG